MVILKKHMIWHDVVYLKMYLKIVVKNLIKLIVVPRLIKHMKYIKKKKRKYNNYSRLTKRI
jgi:hypothetical protein